MNQGACSSSFSLLCSVKRKVCSEGEMGGGISAIGVSHGTISEERRVDAAFRSFLLNFKTVIRRKNASSGSSEFGNGGEGER